MRVAQVIGKLADGGVEAVVNNYYRHTDAGSIQFDYFIDEDSERPPSPEMISRGARYYTVPSSRHMLRRVRALTRLFRQNGYTIVHAHMNTLNAPVLYAAWRAKAPVRISHNHSMGHPREGKRNAVKQALRLTGGWFATMRLACGEAAGRWLFGSRAFDRGRVTVLPNAVDLSAYRFDPQARDRLREELGAGDRLVVGHAGRFTKQKNHGFLLEIFGALLEREPNAVLWLVGEGERKEEIRQLAERMGIADSVAFLGKRSDLAKLYSAMDCFLLPSLYEGVPLVGVEAQAAGLPCFFSTEVSREVAALDEARFIPLDAPAGEWAAAIAGGAPLADEQRTRAADRMQNGPYDLERTGRLLQEIYEAAAPKGFSAV